MYNVKRRKMWMKRETTAQQHAPKPITSDDPTIRPARDAVGTGRGPDHSGPNDEQTTPVGPREDKRAQNTRDPSASISTTTTTTPPPAQDDFFTRNGLSWGDKLLCDDLAQALFPAHATAAHAWQGWCSYSVLATPRRQRQPRRNTTETPSTEKEDDQDDEEEGERQQAYLLQFRPPRHAIDPQVMELAARVYGGGDGGGRPFVPRVAWAGSVVLWPRAVPPAREFLVVGDTPSSSSSSSSPSSSSSSSPSSSSSLKAVAVGEGALVRDGRGGGSGSGSGSPELKLEACAMTVVPGTPYGVVQVRRRALSGDGEVAWQREVVRGFAGFMARGWLRADGGRWEKEGEEVAFVGENARLGLHVATPGKLEALVRELPTPRMQGRAARVLGRYRKLGMDVLPGQAVERRQLLPFTLNHGDIVPGNMLVDEATGRLNGLVDWAEAQIGIWGLGLYGLEFLLGYVSSPSEPAGRKGQRKESGSVAWGAEAKRKGIQGRKFAFTFYEQAPELRALFWEEIERNVGEPLNSPEVREAVQVARDVGVLLWFGYAWDEGRIDRVVNEKDDPRELLLLETFLRLDEGDSKVSPKARL